MLYIKNPAGVPEAFDYEEVDRDPCEDSIFFATDAFMDGENDEESCRLSLSEENITWWTA